MSLIRLCTTHWRNIIRSLLAGNGGTELIFNLVKHLAPKRALLLISGFAEYRQDLEVAGCKIRDYCLFYAL